jgi:tetratricopeptide (TPR) repeat protein
LWYYQHRVGRHYQAQLLNQNVAKALSEADRRRRELHGQLTDLKKVRPLLGDLRRWQALLEETRLVWQQALALADSEPEALEPGLRRRLEELHMELRADEDDHEFVRLLEDLDLDTNTSGSYQPQRTTPKYLAAFAQRGWDIKDGDPAVLAESMVRSPIRYALADALDMWAESERAALGRRINAVARRVDPDPWRDEIRQVQEDQNAEKLVKLAEKVDFAAQSPRHLRFLANRITNAGGDASAIVRKALLHHPGDFWLNVAAARAAPTQADQIGFFRACVAIRPENGIGHACLGFALSAAGLADGLAHCKRAIELAPREARTHAMLGDVLLTNKDLDGAIACFREAIRLEPTYPDVHLSLGQCLETKGDTEGAERAFQLHRQLDAKARKGQSRADEVMSLAALRDGVEGKLGASRWRRVYAVALDAAKSYQIDLVGDFDTLLRVESFAGRQLVSNDDVCQPDLNSRLVFTPPADGTYHLVATAFDTNQNAGKYRLKVSEVAAAAKPLIIKGELIETKDLYKGKFFLRHPLNLTAGRPYVITLRSDAFDTYLILGTKEGIHNNGIVPGNTRVARIDFTPAKTADYTLYVTSGKVRETGAYTVSVEGYEAVVDEPRKARKLCTCFPDETQSWATGSLP